MQVFKFGGASVKSADAIKNLSFILKNFDENILVVISAMDKTTNALEAVCQAYFRNEDFWSAFEKVEDFHNTVIENLGADKSIFSKYFNEIEKLREFLKNNSATDYDYVYDQIVSYGEVFSTAIISDYLNYVGLKNVWLDARDLVITDDYFRFASILSEPTAENLKNAIDFNKSKIYIIQGFIGVTKNGSYTTLGREGSDYSAATFANLLDAKSLTLWKDVAGLYNADPKIYPNAVKIDKISFREATELAYFGAKIIHPKTSKPLMQKNIPLYIKSFKNIWEQGTVIENTDISVSPSVPIFIFSPNQVLLTINSDDFVDEFLLEKVYSIFKTYKTKVNLIQNSALNLSVCFDYNSNTFEKLIDTFKTNFKCRYNTGLTLLNIRHYSKLSNFDFLDDKEILMQLKTRENSFYLYREKISN